MPDHEEKISGIEIPASGVENTSPDTINLTVNYRSAGELSSAEKSFDLSLRKGRCLGLIAKSDIERVSFTLPVTNLEKIGITMVFQDPNSVLVPDKTAGEQICDIFMIHQHLSRKVATERSVKTLKETGISETLAGKYPHELSDEIKQRIVIAAALAHAPKILIANEAACPLDMTIRIQLVRLVKDIIKDSGMALLLITHDPSLFDDVCDDTAMLPD